LSLANGPPSMALTNPGAVVPAPPPNEAGRARFRPPAAQFRAR
jgi:hypothetical protein